MASVLIVDDNKLNLELFRAFMIRFGIESHVASDCATAIEMAGSLSPSAIFMDICMPETSGIDIAGQLRSASATRHIPIYAVTALAPDQIEPEGAALFSGILRKPVSMPQLASVLAEVGCLPPTPSGG